MDAYPYFAKKADGNNGTIGKKIAVCVLCYIAIGVVVNLGMFLSTIGIFTSSCPGGPCPPLPTLMRSVMLNPQFWLNVLIWPVKLADFLRRSF